MKKIIIGLVALAVIIAVAAGGTYTVIQAAEHDRTHVHADVSEDNIQQCGTRGHSRGYGHRGGSRDATPVTNDADVVTGFRIGFIGVDNWFDNRTNARVTSGYHDHKRGLFAKSRGRGMYCTDFAERNGRIFRGHWDAHYGQ